jgi:hypothetical protein
MDMEQVRVKSEKDRRYHGLAGEVARELYFVGEWDGYRRIIIFDPCEAHRRIFAQQESVSCLKQGYDFQVASHIELSPELEKPRLQPEPDGDVLWI